MTDEKINDSFRLFLHFTNKLKRTLKIHSNTNISHAYNEKASYRGDILISMSSTLLKKILKQRNPQCYTKKI